jgi:hypothetical protein
VKSSWKRFDYERLIGQSEVENRVRNVFVDDAVDDLHDVVVVLSQKVDVGVEVVVAHVSQLDHSLFVLRLNLVRILHLFDVDLGSSDVV